MDISIIIPTRNRPDKLSECLRCLGRQQIPITRGLSGLFEVLVSLDGADEPSRLAANTAWAESETAERQPTSGTTKPLRIIEGPRQGLAAARNRALQQAAGRWIVSINDDLYAQPGFLAEHALGHLDAIDHGGDAVIVGDSPFGVARNDTLFDRLVRETSLVFFYDKMNQPGAREDTQKDWGFRHCFGLNHSTEAAALLAVGGYTIFPARYGYEDIEAAWRLRERFGTRVLYRPAAKGTHDHRFLPDEYLARENTLGHAALGFAQVSPACAYETFGRDITAVSEIAYSREFVKREAATAQALRGSFVSLGHLPSDAIIAGPGATTWINMVYEQHLLLKRWEWRRGLVRAADESAHCQVGAVHVQTAQTTPATRAA